MERVFEHLGYHLEAYHPISKKYLGYVKIDEVADNTTTGYYSRKLETLNHIATKGSKQFLLEGEFITELIPLCGRIIGDSRAVLERSQAWR
tara:strand:+ start:72 stop:344 length:273 start_codon:yes stop_codon:yes gene_type:complete